MKKYRSVLLSFVLMLSFLTIAHGKQALSYVIEPQYEMVQSFSEGLAAIFVDEQWGYVDKSGRVVIQPQYDLALPFNDGLAAVAVDGGWGFIDKTGTMKIKPKFDAVDYQPDYRGGFSEGLAAVSLHDKWGFIDKTGTIVIEPQFDYANSFSEGLAAVAVNDLFGFIDKSGTMVIEPAYEMAMSFSEGFASVYFFGGWGFIDKTGDAFTGFIYSDPAHFKDGLAPVDDGFINTEGRLVIDFLAEHYYDKADSFHEGIALVYKISQRQFLYGFMDKSGKEIVMPQYIYDRSVQFSEGLAAIVVDDKWGFIDKTGKQVITPQFDDISGDFSDGLVGVSIRGKWGFIDASFNASSAPVVKEEPSSWAEAEVAAAIAFDLVPKLLQQDYKNHINRGEFSELIVYLFSVTADMTVDEWLADIDGRQQENVFSDTNDPMVLAAYHLGIVNGKGNGKFDPHGEITRQEAAVMLQRAALKLDADVSPLSSPYADNDVIADWAIDGVMYVGALNDPTVNRAVMSGVANYRFDPLGKYTREQAFITIKRMLHAT